MQCMSVRVAGADFLLSLSKCLSPCLYVCLSVYVAVADLLAIRFDPELVRTAKAMLQGRPISRSTSSTSAIVSQQASTVDY